MYNALNGTDYQDASQLAQYLEFVGVTRKFTAGENHVETALADAVDYCIGNGILADFLKKNRAEVFGMLLEEFDVKKYEKTLRKEGREEERKDGIRFMIEALQEAGQSENYVMKKLEEKYSLSGGEAEKKIRQYWK